MIRIVRDGVFAGLLLAATCSVAPAGGHSHWNTLNRKLGLGWSDGYHAYNGCEGQCQWTSIHGDAGAMPLSGPVQPTIAPAPAFRKPVPAVRSSQLPQKGPLLPSQKFSPKPAYWYR